VAIFSRHERSHGIDRTVWPGARYWRGFSHERIRRLALAERSRARLGREESDGFEKRRASRERGGGV